MYQLYYRKENIVLIEILGYIASFIILIGFVSTNQTVIRKFNIVGSVLYVIYGFLIHAYPLVLLNAFIIIVHLKVLVKKHEV